MNLSLPVEAIGPAGEADEFATAELTEEGVLIEGFFAPSVGLSWKDLFRVISHPFAQEKLAEAEEQAP